MGRPPLRQIAITSLSCCKNTKFLKTNNKTIKLWKTNQ